MRRAVSLVAVAVLTACSSGSPAPVSPSSERSSVAAPTGTRRPAPGPSTSATEAAGVCREPLPETATGELPELALEPVVTEGLVHPTFVTAPPDDPRLFVLELDGRIRVVRDGRLLDDPFLDLTDVAEATGDGGLIGLAFHPDYASNGRFFVHYDDADADTRLVEYAVSEDPDRADPGSARELLTVEQPAVVQQGGTVAFGPDGHLYLGLGDGGDRDAGGRTAQDPTTLLGSLLRLDVDAEPSGDRPYAIPQENPYAEGEGGAPEVWAVGLRNPWRFSFDGCRLVLSDVGSKSWEELDVLPIDAREPNLGWPIVEGSHCHEPADGCDRTGLVEPVLDYPHEDDSCAIVGGPVYRGPAIPELHGTVLYTDYCAGFLRAARLSADRSPRALETFDLTDDVGRLGFPLSFGTDAAGEVYVAEAGGTVSRIVRAP